MRRVEVPLRVLDVGKIREAVYDSRMFGVQEAPYAQGFLVIRPSGGYLALRLEQKAKWFSVVAVSLWSPSFACWIASA